jgi:DNA-binding transcriptional LysR family regulator
MPLSPHLPDLASLELLLDVGTSGSIGAAAKLHGISQQAASSRLRNVEAQVGVPLLHRDVRGARFTSQGALLADWASRVLDSARELDGGIAALRADRRARLRISASLTVAEHLLPGWLVALHAHQTQAGARPTSITLDATNSDQVAESVLAGRCDVGFIEGPDLPPGLRSRTVATDSLVLVVRPDHPWARRRRPVTTAELAATPLVTREPGSGTRRALERALAMPQADSALELTTTSSVREAVLAGAAPAVLSTLTVADALATGRLVQVATVGIALDRTLRAVWIGSPQPPSGPVRELVAVAESRAGR